MKKVPAFPPPNPNDPPEVAAPLRNAAVLWAAHRHREAIPQLVRAAAAAKTKSAAPQTDPRVVELALAATELAAFVENGEDPRSIPISLDFDTHSVSLSSLEESVLEIDVVSRQSSAPKQTLPEENRPTPPPAPAPKTPLKAPSKIDLTETLPQGARAPQPAQPPLNIRVVRPAQTPPAQSLKEAPFTEPNERTSALPTKRMEDVPTRRADEEEKKK